MIELIVWNAETLVMMEEEFKVINKNLLELSYHDDLNECFIFNDGFENEYLYMELKIMEDDDNIYIKMMILDIKSGEVILDMMNF